VVRPFLEVTALAIAAAELTLLKALEAGETLGEAAAAAIGIDDGFDLQASLLAHFRLGIFSGFAVPQFQSQPVLTPPCRSCRPG
jgi:hypothetical protein